MHSENAPTMPIQTGRPLIRQARASQKGLCAQPARQKRRRTPGERLIGAIAALAEGQARILRHDERSWASITFAGTRHRVEMVFNGEEAVERGECFIAFLPDHEFAIPGQLVADATVIAVDHRLAPPQLRVTCELLLLEDG